MSDSMVKSAADYEYVTGANVDDEHPHGDLDRIQIDGGIMTVRGGNAIRGEDIAFLTEFANQRRFAVTGGSMIVEGKEKTLKAYPKDFSATGASVFSRELTSRGLDSPNNEFRDLADLSEATSTSSGLYYNSISFFDAPPTLTFAHSRGTDRSLDHDVLVKLIADSYIVKSFDVSSLTVPDSGDPLKKKIVMDYFDASAKIKDNGVCLIGSTFNVDTISFASASSTDGGLKYQRSVGTWTSYHKPEGYDLIPDWGVLEDDAELIYPFATIYNHYYGHGFPPAGCSMMTVDAPHGANVIALCAFFLFSQDRDKNVVELSVLLRPYSMVKEGSQTFALKSDAFASASAVDEIVAASGISTPDDESSDDYTSHYKRIGIDLKVFPVVYFDSHTNWSANG